MNKQTVFTTTDIETVDSYDNDSIECDGFEEFEEGVRLYDEVEEGPPTETDDKAYIPHDRLNYILPSGEN